MTRRAYPSFLVSAVFHYLGPAFAVLLFVRVKVLGALAVRNRVAALLFAAPGVYLRPTSLAVQPSGSFRVRELPRAYALYMVAAPASGSASPPRSSHVSQTSSRSSACRWSTSR